MKSATAIVLVIATLASRVSAQELTEQLQGAININVETTTGETVEVSLLMLRVIHVQTIYRDDVDSYCRAHPDAEYSLIETVESENSIDVDEIVAQLARDGTIDPDDGLSDAEVETVTEATENAYALNPNVPIRLTIDCRLRANLIENAVQ